MIAIRGYKSRIAEELIKLLPKSESVAHINRHALPTLDASRYFFCAGLIRAKTMRQQEDHEIAESFWVNSVQVIQTCDRLIEQNDKARIVVMGSESGFSGSFDGAYATAKAALHRYVETKKLRTPDQQLVCVAPSIIWDTAMTARRHDGSVLEQKQNEHPKKRFLSSKEVALLVYHLLYVDQGYLSGTVIRMNGGGHIR